MPLQGSTAAALHHLSLGAMGGVMLPTFSFQSSLFAVPEVTICLSVIFPFVLYMIFPMIFLVIFPFISPTIFPIIFPFVFLLLIVLMI